MPQPKGKDWLNGYKNKTTIYAVYKKPREPNQDKPKEKHHKTHINQINEHQTQRTNIKSSKGKTTNQMATELFLSINTLNVNGLNAPTKRQDWLNGYKSTTPIYAIYKRHTSKQEIHKD